MGKIKEETTELLRAWQDGDKGAQDRLIETVHCQLVRLAAHHFSGERSNHTLQPTALVNEVYIRLAGQGQLVLNDRTHFLAIASRLMRRVLVDHARQYSADKRRAQAEAVELESAGDMLEASKALPIHKILDLDLALKRLESKGERLARVVELKYFGGMSIDEVAAALEISLSTVKQDWRFAKAWLRKYLA